MFMRERWDKAALFLQPLEHEAGDVPGVARRGVRHGVGVGLHFVVEDGRRAFHRMAEQVFAHDDDDEARRADVLWFRSGCSGRRRLGGPASTSTARARR